MKKRLRIVFMGTPEFAVASLDAIVNSEHDVVGVITAPDKPAGRGKDLQTSAVKKYAIEKGLRLLQPEKLKSPDFLEELESLHADLQVVVAFRMLPEVVWKMPSLGTFNLHASLLPQFRGAAPINHAIINGMKTTGVTTFFLDEKIDTGKIMYRESVEIEEHDNAGSLHDKLMIMGAELVKKTVDDIAIGNFQTTSQQSYLQKDEKLIEAPKIFKEFCKIDWNNSVVELNNFIRGLSPYPTAHTTIHNHDSKAFLLKIFKTKMDKTSPLSGLPGAIKTDNKKILSFECTDGFLIIEELQLEGKKRMTTEEFLKGFRLNETK